MKLDAVFAAADSKSSQRPRLTVEPLAQALGLTINASYKDKDYQPLVDELRARHKEKSFLLCWHHGKIAALLQALGADLPAVLPGGQWPEDVYNWVIVLRYDANGTLAQAQREIEPF